MAGDENIGVGEGSAVDHKADHDLAGFFAPSQKDVAHKTLMGLFVIDGRFIFFEKVFDQGEDIAEEVRLKGAGEVFHDAVAAGGEKPDLHLAVLSETDRILGFVAVAGLGGGTLDGQSRRIDAADAAEMLSDPAFFDAQFLRIADVPQTASAALSGNGAAVCDPAGCGGENFVNDAVGVFF